MIEAHITYVTLTEHVIPVYVAQVDAAETLPALQAVVAEWAWCAEDAYSRAKSMTDADFATFRAGLLNERAGRLAGEEWAREFGCIPLPEEMLKTAYFAYRLQVPWGCAWKRIKQLRAEGVRI